MNRAKTLLSIVFPTLDLKDESIDAYLQNGVLPQLPMRAPHPQQNLQNTRIPPLPQESVKEEPHDSHLESMVKATGQLDIDEEGNWDYHGHSSGLSFMRRLQQQFGDLIPPSETSGSPFPKYRPLSQVFDSPDSYNQSPVDLSGVRPAGTDLPSKKEARVLCDKAILEASALMRVIHLPSFYKSLDRIYECPPEDYGNVENSFLPLLYATLALGTLFTKPDTAAGEIGYVANIEDG